MIFRAVIPNPVLSEVEGSFSGSLRKDEMLNQACAEFISVSSMTTKPFAEFIPSLCSEVSKVFGATALRILTEGENRADIIRQNKSWLSKVSLTKLNCP